MHEQEPIVMCDKAIEKLEKAIKESEAERHRWQSMVDVQSSIIHDAEAKLRVWQRAKATLEKDNA